MDINLYEKTDGLYLDPVFDFELDEILDCGQCFRFHKQKDGSYVGVAGSRPLHIAKKENTVILYGITKQDFAFWEHYFDLQTDYTAIKNLLSQDERFYNACQYCPGMRILRQDPFEVLISFIISQNNNIPRIKGIISRLCEHFGESIAPGLYGFPSPEVLANCSLEDLAILRSGFRAKYILDATQKVSFGEIDLLKLQDMDYASAKEELLKIKGVGDKVADCVLLYGYYKMDAFPKDVWIRRALKEWFQGELPDCCKDYGGIAQQYLFHYIRTGVGTQNLR